MSVRWFITEVGFRNKLRRNLFHARNLAEVRQKLAKRISQDCEIGEVVAQFVANRANVREISQDEASDHFHLITFQSGHD